MLYMYHICIQNYLWLIQTSTQTPDIGYDLRGVTDTIHISIPQSILLAPPLTTYIKRCIRTPKNRLNKYLGNNTKACYQQEYF